MWNKFFVILFVGILAFSLSAQQYRTSRRNRGRDGQSANVQQKKPAKKVPVQQADSATAQAPAAKKSKFDPKKPALTQKQIDNVINGQIRKNLLECKISTKLPGRKDADEDAPEDEEKPEDGKKSKKNTFISRLDFSIMMSHYSSLISHFELTEVSRIRPEWYQQFQTELSKFGLIINEMTIAVRAGSDGRYTAGVQKFKAHQEACLKFLKERPPRITNEEYQALWQKNTRIRQQNYLKQLKAEREAAMKRRQEQLKQLQQKNQSKKKDQGAANKK